MNIIKQNIENLQGKSVTSRFCRLPFAEIEIERYMYIAKMATGLLDDNCG